MLNRLVPILAPVKIRNGTSGEFFGMQPGAVRLTVSVFVLALAAAPMAARAQDMSGPLYANASPPSKPADEAEPQNDKPLTVDEATVLGNALMFDTTNIAAGKTAKSLRLPGLKDPDKFDVSHTDKPDGSSTMVLKQPLANASEWDARVGADLNLAATPASGYQANRPLPLITGAQNSGAAWASVGVPNLASVDARVDPTNDQGKLGTTFKQAIPVGSKFAVTLQNTYSMTENFTSSTATPSDIPLMATPVAGPPTPQIWGTEKAVKFNVLTTGTTFGAGVTTASNDPITHNTFSAEQKLYGPLHVTTAVTDLGQPTTSKSVSAAFKLNW
jgi:hypothetical protein